MFCIIICHLLPLPTNLPKAECPVAAKLNDHCPLATIFRFVPTCDGYAELFRLARLLPPQRCRKNPASAWRPTVRPAPFQAEPLSSCWLVRRYCSWWTYVYIRKKTFSSFLFGHPPNP